MPMPFLFALFPVAAHEQKLPFLHRAAADHPGCIRGGQRARRPAAAHDDHQPRHRHVHRAAGRHAGEDRGALRYDGRQPDAAQWHQQPRPHLGRAAPAGVR